jgi:ferrochelatase
MARTAVVIFNLGGPDSLEAVQPFLFNLFNDPLIIRQPRPVRWLIAKLISTRRTPVAKEIYRQMGGRSPILEETQKQADALQNILGDESGYRVFISMRYWHPFAEDCAAEVKAYAPDRIILLPLYPQFSTTTTESFQHAWKIAAAKNDLDCPSTLICCYPTEPGLIDAMVMLTKSSLEKITRKPNRILFSAHGLPAKFVAAGDPYQAHVEMTVAAIVDRLEIPDLDYVICYQSRVGPVEWLHPYTDDEIRRAGRDKVSVTIIPVAFVSEHSETLVELDIEYAKLASEVGVPEYVRGPTVGENQHFIQGLARLVTSGAHREIVSGTGQKFCAETFGACAYCQTGGA